ncbi:carbohydrate ABC transporter permease [Sinosporangium siamense]|uniref:ABC transporter permease n=1 Tax=Sinosporangium siamense TaxID=1367973 RepID=A0A919RLP1_9ACTN|nr:sugar ABC transporter permease [Sinosporangium siamense]GII96097.1 ABC transporter permease [Sinosporangium siamense]
MVDPRQGRTAVPLVLPTLLTLGVVVVFPLFQAVRLSMYGENADLDVVFRGIANFTDFLVGPLSGQFWIALGNTTLFTVVSVTLELAIGLGMAMAMHHVVRGRGLLRAAVLVPWAVPTAMAALLWKWIFTPHGVANAVLGTDIVWGAEAWASRLAVVVADVWKTAPFMALLILAGLQVIPRELYEAARVDGAGAWQRFRRVTLPMIHGALLVAVLMRMLDALRVFDLPFLFAGSADNEDLVTLSMLGYKYAVQQADTGSGSAVALLTLLYVAVVAYLFVRLLGADALGTRSARKAGGRRS